MLRPLGDLIEPMQRNPAKVYAPQFRAESAADTIPAMKLLLLDTAADMEQFASLLDGTGQFETTIAYEMSDALEVLQTNAVDAVVVATSFKGGGKSFLDILRECEPGNPSVLVIVDVLDEMHELMGSDMGQCIEDFVVRPADDDILQARLMLLRRRRSIVPPRQALLQALPDLMFRIRRDGTFIDYHSPLREQLYMEPTDIKGSRLMDVMPPEVADISMEMMARVLDTGEPGIIEYNLPLPSGVQSFEARLVQCGVDEVLTIVRDVTERRRVDSELRAAAEIKRAFTSRVVSAQEAERQALSRELHDGIGQMLLVHRMSAEWLAKQAVPGPVRDAAEELSSSLDRTLEAVRNLAMDLRPPAIDDLGIGSALETLVDNNAKRSGLRCECEIEPTVAFVPTDISVAIYRIAQEALGNAIRHAQGQNIIVSLSHSGTDIELRVLDDGIGFDPAQANDPSCLGLVGMRERAELVGGRVSIESRANQGTCVKVSVPHLPVSPME